MEAPLTPKPRSVARCPQGDDRVLRRDGDAAAVPRFQRSPACLEDAGPATSPLRYSVARRTRGAAPGETPHGAFPGGLSPVV